MVRCWLKMQLSHLKHLNFITNSITLSEFYTMFLFYRIIIHQFSFFFFVRLSFFPLKALKTEPAGLFSALLRYTGLLQTISEGIKNKPVRSWLLSFYCALKDNGAACREVKWACQSQNEQDRSRGWPGCFSCLVFLCHMLVGKLGACCQC